MVWIIVFVIGVGILVFWPVYDRIKGKKAKLQKDLKPYTRRLCSTLEELREMPQDAIDAQAYGAYMDGAR